jgi:hypothetical protein
MPTSRTKTRQMLRGLHDGIENFCAVDYVGL